MAGGMPVTGAMQTPPADKTPAVAEQPWFHMVNLEALVDSYYMLNLKHLDSGADSMTSPVGRNFDTVSNSFSLNYAKVGLGLNANPVAFRLDLGYGHTGAIINAASASESLMAAAAALYGNAFFVQQAFASLTLGNMLTIDFGKFVTTAGAEVIEANKNWLYSRSFLFFIIPLVHTGARLNLKLSEELTLQASVVNGVNNDPDNNADKTLGLSGAYAAGGTNLVLTGYWGRRAPGADRTLFLDFVGSHALSDSFGLNLNIDYVRNSADSYAVGGSLMGRYVLSENFVLAARGEAIKDKALMFMGSDTMIYEGTVMAGLPFAKHFEARLELRGDFAGDPIFNGADNQFTSTLAFLGFM